MIETQLIEFNHVWKEHWASTQSLEKITNECITLTNNVHSEWLNKNDTCYKSSAASIAIYDLHKLYSQTRYNNRVGKRYGAPYRKVKNFSNQ